MYEWQLEHDLYPKGEANGDTYTRLSMRIDFILKRLGSVHGILLTTHLKHRCCERGYYGISIK